MDQWKQIYRAQGPYASVLVDVSLDAAKAEHELEVRAAEVAQRLGEAGAPRAVTEEVARLIAEPVHRPAPRARHLVLGEHEVLSAEILPRAVAETRVSWAALPDLGPLIADRADGTAFVVVSVDHSGGSVSTYDSRALERRESASVAGEDQHLQKVRGGGMAHRRYQRTSEETWRENAREVADLALSKVRDGHRLVIVAGSPESRSEVAEALAATPAEVVVLDRAGERADGGEESLALDLRAAVEQHLHQRRQSLVDRVNQALGQGDGAVTGIDDVVAALVLGRVETLLIDCEQLSEQDLAIADHPGLVIPGVDDRVRADLALVALAVGTDATVLPVPHGLDASVAALLRWSDGGPPAPAAAEADLSVAGGGR